MIILYHKKPLFKNAGFFYAFSLFPANNNNDNNRLSSRIQTWFFFGKDKGT